MGSSTLAVGWSTAEVRRRHDPRGCPSGGRLACGGGDESRLGGGGRGSVRWLVGGWRRQPPIEVVEAAGLGERKRRMEIRVTKKKKWSDYFFPTCQKNTKAAIKTITAYCNLGISLLFDK